MIPGFVANHIIILLLPLGYKAAPLRSFLYELKLGEVEWNILFQYSFSS